MVGTLTVLQSFRHVKKGCVPACWLVTFISLGTMCLCRVTFTHDLLVPVEVPKVIWLISFFLGMITTSTRI